MELAVEPLKEKNKFGTKTSFVQKVTNVMIYTMQNQGLIKESTKDEVKAKEFLTRVHSILHDED